MPNHTYVVNHTYAIFNRNHIYATYSFEAGWLIFSLAKAWQESKFQA